MRSERRYDVVVIGAGTAGLVAGARLAQSGASVCVVAKGIGSTHLAPGTVDVLGYLPTVDGSREHNHSTSLSDVADSYCAVTSPAHAVAALAETQPGHPYSQIGADAVRDGTDWLVDTVAAGPLEDYRYVGRLDRNLLLPTAAGALKPSAFAPATIAGGDATDNSLSRVCIVGLSGLRDFYPKLCAANLRAAGLDVTDATLGLKLDRADANTLGIARRMDDAGWRHEFCARLAPLVSGSDRVGLPAILGLRDPARVRRDVEDRIGRPVFEIPTLPPSVPGMRLYEVLRSALRTAGGQLVLGAGVVSHQRVGAQVKSVATLSAGHDTRFAADWFVLATGGLHSGAITLDASWQVTESVLGLPLTGVPADGDPRFRPTYFAEQPIARVGVSVDQDLTAHGTENVSVAGASLPGSVPWREASGEGIALSSGYRAAQVIAAQLGARTGVRT